ncbi:MAG: transporter permease [Acidimicrobiaceae bacterium]|jgi:peptide/nickel transport system permease protein|nr:transporter permease [Acidimicrobiaceae bacterium]
MSELATPVVTPEPMDAVNGEPAARHRTWFGTVWRSRNGRIGFILSALVVLGAIFGSLGVTPYPPDAQNFNASLKGISLAHVLGTDQFGRDVFSQILQALGVSLEIAGISVLIAGGIGTLGGIVAGFLGRWPSALIMRVTDVMFAIPAILLALAIVTALGPSIIDSSIAIGVGYIPIFVRVVRGPVLALREADFVRAGRVLGFSRSRLLFRHILPSVAGAVAVQTSLALAWAILAEASLSFLGLGPPPPTASLGEMVSESSSLASTAWWTLAGPSIAIIIAVIGFNFLGDGLRAAADPRSKTR